MPDAIAQLCQIIIEKLREQPRITQVDLITQVEMAIAEDPQLATLLQADPQMLQNNRNEATGIQNLVKGGTVYNGNHYDFHLHLTHLDLSDREKFQVALTTVLRKLQTIEQPVGIPQNLPHSGIQPEEFVGRQDELQWLHNRLQKNDRVVISAIAGMGGIGKTELAIQYALTHQRDYPGGICWIFARATKLDCSRTDIDVSSHINISSTHTTNIAEQIIRFAQTLDLHPSETIKAPLDKVRWCWQHWQPGKVLLILDDVTDYASIHLYLPSDPRFRVLITSRLRLLKDSERLEVKVLKPEAALSLLELLTGAEQVQTEVTVAKEICQWLGYLPLGLELVGRYLARKPDLSLAEMSARLQAKRLYQPALQKPKIESDMTAKRGVAAAFELSWNDLSPIAQELGCLLSIFDIVPLPWSLIEQCAANHSPEELEESRDNELLGFHLLQREDKGIYKLHELIREFFQSKLIELFQAESLHQVVTLKVAATARKNPLLAHEILDKKLLGWQWVSDATQLSAVEWGWQVRTATQAWIDGLGVLARLLFPLREDNSLPVMGASIRQDRVDMTGKPTVYMQTVWNFSQSTLEEVIELPSISEQPWQDDNNGWQAAWRVLVDAGWNHFYSAPLNQRVSWAWERTFTQIVSSLSQRLQDRSLPIEAGYLSMEAAWYAAAHLTKRSFASCNPIPLDELEEQLSKTRKTSFSVRIQHCINQLKVEIAVLRSQEHAYFSLPPSVQNFRQHRVHSSDGAMAYIAGIYEGAVKGYEQLINTWFPALKPKMQIASTLPAQIVGSVNFTFDGVDISWFWEALPEGYQSGVDFYQSNCSFTENNSRYQTAWQQIHARRPQGLRYPSLKKLIIPLNVLRFQACPATEQAYQWLWGDLQRINWVEGSLKDAGYPYWR